MSQINISNLTFRYDTNAHNVFEGVNLVLDTDWKLGLIGRNGRGKTTLLKILNGDLIPDSTSNITSCVEFGYFPMEVFDKTLNTIDVVKNAIAPFALWEKEMEEYLVDESKLTEYGEVLEKYVDCDGYIIDELIKKECGLIDLDFEILDRPFETLSGGEQTKMLLIALFLRKNHFLLIDEPTNHLDIKGREIVAEYLASKKGFILVSHDKNFVDRVVDHILSINKSDIEIQKGNFSTWEINKDRQDGFEIAENEKLKKDIDRLKKTAKEKAEWSDHVEATKIGNGACDRGYIGHKAAKMMKRSKAIENRQNRAIEEKTKLLKNLEKEEKLELYPCKSSKERVATIKNLTISYDNRSIFENLNFEINKGECVSLRGENGSGKSSIIKLFLGEEINYSGDIDIPKNISYIPQDTSFLVGELKDFICNNKTNETILKSYLVKLGFERKSFEKSLEEWSEGQKKKLLIAKSLCDEAELYIWDEPLNFTDIITRRQIEEVIRRVKPTLLIVEHDSSFINSVATKEVVVEKYLG